MTHALFRRTLVRRVTLALALAFAAAWGVLIAFQYHEAQQREERAPREFGAELEALLAQSEDVPQARAVMATVARLVTRSQRLRGVPAPTFIELWDLPAGQRVFFAGQDSAGTPAGPAQQLSLQRIDGRPHRVLRSDAGRWSARIAIPVQGHAWLLARLGDEILPYLLIAFPVVLLPVWLVVSQGLKPLRRLSQRIAERGADDLAPVAAGTDYDELVPLVAAINRLLSQLRTKVEREAGFVHDAAHELRTPWAVMAVQADLLSRATTDAERREAAQRLGDALARASRLMRQLLSLARIEAQPPGAPTTVDLAQLVREELAQADPLAEQRGIALSLQAPQRLVRALDAQAFQSIVQNLLDNALRYGRAGGRVTVVLSAADGHVDLSVADDGPGIAAGTEALVFERFYRGTGHDVPGSGLGLSIVKQACRKLRGEVSLGPGLQARGCRFAVRLPSDTAGR